jgi:predicted patatin/cPLA2 family phospholipase
VLGIPDARFFFVRNPAAIERAFTAAGNREAARLGLSPRAMRPVSNLLAVSGGGEDGAFGAGLLCGWTQHGTRPEFNLVTGVSTGALTAPFAFLGPAYDDALRDVYTNVTAANVAERRNLLNAVFNDALADTAPLFKTISRHLDETMMSALARAHDDGRLLLIGTTNLDAQTPVIWNIGAIAKSGHPKALDLVRRILLASAAIPGAFPPVMIDVELDGERFQEMHVDGGAFAQAFLYPAAVGEARQARQRRGESVRDVQAYVIRNARLDPNWAVVERRTMGILGRAVSTMIFSSGFNDVVRMYFNTQRDGIDYNLAFISADFTGEFTEPFDQAYMRELYDYGEAQARRGFDWSKAPPLG